MINPEIIGFIAGILVACSLIPQTIKSWRTKSTSDISISWMLINISGQTLWIVYGFMIDSLSLIIMSSITLFFAISLFILKIKHG
ncbi:MAG: SemiSWEET family transporter [Patescibacteria group bacterium]